MQWQTDRFTFRDIAEAANRKEANEVEGSERYVSPMLNANVYARATFAPSAALRPMDSRPVQPFETGSIGLGPRTSYKLSNTTKRAAGML